MTPETPMKFNGANGDKYCNGANGDQHDNLVKGDNGFNVANAAPLLPLARLSATSQELIIVIYTIMKWRSPLMPMAALMPMAIIVSLVPLASCYYITL